MPLDKQKAYVPLTEGLDTKSDDKFVVPGKVVTCENGVYNKIGEITKRNGYSHRTQDKFTTGTLTESQGIYTLEDELLVESESSLHSFSETNDSWVDRGRLLRPTLDNTETVIRNGSEQLDLQFATVAGYRLYAWTDSRGGVRYSIGDTATGTWIVYDTELDATGTDVRVIGSTDTWHITYRQTTTVYYHTVTTASLTTVSSQATLLTSLAGSHPLYDIKADGTDIYASFLDTSTDLVTNKYINFDMSSVSITDTFVSPNFVTNVLRLVITTVSSTTYIHLGYNGGAGSDIVNYTYDTSLTEAFGERELTSPTASFLAGVQADSTSHDITWFGSEVWNSDPDLNTVFTGVIGTGGVVTSIATKQGYILATQAFAINDIAYVGINSVAQAQNTLFFIDNSFRVIAKVAPGESNNGEDTEVMATVEVTNNEVTFAYNRVTEFVIEDNRGTTVLGFFAGKLNFNYSIQASTAEINGLKYIAGSQLKVYDGVSVFEEGYNLFPEITSVASTGSPGSVADGTYQYTAIFEWLDNKGNIHRSAPAIPSTFTVTGGPKQNIIDTTELNITDKELNSRADVKKVLYRTEDAGTVFYRVGELSSGSFLDGNADSSITSNEVLYTTGGRLENIQSPACTIITEHQKRLFIGGLENEDQVQYSTISEDFVAPGFNESLTLDVPVTGGKIKGLSTHNAGLLIFRETYTYLSTGLGPNNTGLGGIYSEPETLFSDLGAESHHGIISTPRGVIFKSNKGFYLIDRGLNPSYLGAAVEEFNDRTVTSAVLVFNDNEVRFTTTNGEILVYNYEFDKWSVFTDKAAVGSVLRNNTHNLVTSAGLVKYEDSSTYLDNSAFVSLKLKTGWLSFDNIAGLQRVYRVRAVGDYHTSHKLNVDISYNFDDTQLETHTLAVTSDPQDYIFDIRHQYQKGTSIQYTVRDSAPDSGTGTGQGASFSGLRLVVGVKEILGGSASTRTL